MTLLNYRADGTPFWNEIAISRCSMPTTRSRTTSGVQSDVTARVRVEAERERLLTAERAARSIAEQSRRAAEVAQRRLALLAEATSLLAATLDLPVAVERLAGLLVPVLADGCVVEIEADGFQPGQMVVRHVAADAEQALAALAVRPVSSVRRHPRGLTPPYAWSPPPDHLAAAPDDERALLQRVGVRSIAVVPLHARRAVLGRLWLVNGPDRPAFADADVDLLADLGRRAALAVENARLYTREHGVAETLQRSLLPELPEVPGLLLAARYLPSARDVEVGGDWYDVLPLPDGSIGLAIGDVMGHDLSAAAAMGQLRSVLRGYAWEGDAPASVLDRLDRLAQGMAMAELATVLYARVERAGAGRDAVLTVANAGHQPPILVAPRRHRDPARGRPLGSCRCDTGARGQPAPAGAGAPGRRQHPPPLHRRAGRATRAGPGRRPELAGRGVRRPCAAGRTGRADRAGGGPAGSPRARRRRRGAGGHRAPGARPRVTSRTGPVSRRSAGRRRAGPPARGGWRRPRTRGPAAGRA